MLLLDAGALLLLDLLLAGFAIADGWAAIGLAGALGALNALAWPLMVRIALPVTVLSLGLGALVLNGVVLLAAARIGSGVVIESVWVAMAIALGLGVLTGGTAALLSLDDDSSWQRNVVRRQLRRDRLLASGEETGTLFLEIDGLSHGVLRRALRDGNAPTLARWVRDGGHRLLGWETGWSSQTLACQAGLLHGSDDGIPAFRWWEKEAARMLVANHPRDTRELERRRSDGAGLLAGDGASRANLLSGDAPHSSLTVSTVLEADRPGRRGRDYFGYFASPYGWTRTATRAAAEVVLERWQARGARRRGVEPRIRRGWRYALLRTFATVVQLDLQVATVTADVLAGRPVVYSTFLAYDEVAHHSGVERAETLAILRRVDRAIGRIAAAVDHAPRPYRIVVLSDHGQSQGAPFADCYGETIEQLVRRLAGRPPGDPPAPEPERSDETLGQLGAGLTQLAGRGGAVGRAVRGATGRRADDGQILLDRAAAHERAGAAAGLPELVVTASGNLATVSFPRRPGRLTLEQIELEHPGLIDGLRCHPGIGFLLVRSASTGGLVLGADGARWLRDGSTEGVDPLDDFGPNAAQHVARTDGFANCPDLVINGGWWPGLEEVAAFESFVGSHGGMGGEQSHAFALVPSDLPAPRAPVVGPAAMHGWLVRWRDA